MFTIEYYKKEQFHLLKDKWEELERGTDMTPYQNYAWYDMLNKHYVPNDSKNQISRYALVKDDGKCIFIAPLWIILHTFNLVNKKGCYFLGRSGWSDYLNFVYNSFNIKALSFLFNDIAKEFNVKDFVFESLLKNTRTYEELSKFPQSQTIGDGIAVELQLPKTTEDFKQMLSKNTRQNIRTAHNRLAKNGIDIEIIYNDQNVDKDKCWRIREERFLKKFKNTSRLRKFKYFVMKKLTFHFKSFLPFYTFDKGHFLTTYHGNVLCSFFYYLHDKRKRQILILAAGVNSEYSKYSPGFISLFDFINQLIIQGNVDIVDFTLGDEKYKYSIGGKNKYINGVKIKL